MRVQKHLAVSLFLLFHVYANKITKSYIFFFFFKQTNQSNRSFDLIVYIRVYRSPPTHAQKNMHTNF